MSYRNAWKILLRTKAFYVALALDVVGVALMFVVPVPWHFVGILPIAAGCFIIVQIGD